MTAGPSVEIDVGDLRVAASLMLAAAATQPLWSGISPGVPCLLRATTGIPCPLCGMTTSVCATVALDVGTAVAANPFGIVAVLVAILLLVRPRIETLTVPRGLAAAALAASWAWQLARVA
jgi:hypothetical protein